MLVLTSRIKLCVDLHLVYIIGRRTVVCPSSDSCHMCNTETEFPELRIIFEEVFEIEVQEGSVLKYLNFRIFHSPLGLSVDRTG